MQAPNSLVRKLLKPLMKKKLPENYVKKCQSQIWHLSETASEQCCATRQTRL